MPKEATWKQIGLRTASSPSTMALGVAGKPMEWKSHTWRFNNQNKRLRPKDYSGFTRLLESQSWVFCFLLEGTFPIVFKWAVLFAFSKEPLSSLLKHSTADASNSLAGMQTPSKLWTDTGLYKGQIFPFLPCLWFNLEKLTANHFVSSEILFNASPEEEEKTPSSKQAPLTPEIFSWWTALLCKLNCPKAPFKCMVFK